MFNKLKKGTDSIGELILIYLFFAVVVSVLFALFEGKDFFTSLWWSFITGLTIGYGDVYAVTAAGRVLTVLWAFLSILFLTPLFIGRVVVIMMDNKNEFTDKEQRSMMKMLKELTNVKK